MYLKRLELLGFKSFPEKIRLEFNRGVTCVVGPNGSGKSNISDAVRWVLGEQSAKSLRGGKMEDVIFAGTAARRALGYAEASMILDNSDGAIPLDYNEVSVTRRAFRSGENQYIINGSQCRLKDVHTLFMDTGVGREGYSIIGQGQIEEILSVKSEDRRELFEEAAGIVKYKARKREAEFKLEREKQNLDRAGDIIAELEALIVPAGEQAEKARRFLDLSDQLKLIRVNIFLNKIKKADDDEAATARNIAGIDDNLAGAETERAANQNEIIDIKNRIEETDKEFGANAERGQEIRLAAEKKENAIEIIKNRISQREKDMERLRSENLGFEAEIKRNGDESEALESELRSCTCELETKKAALADEELAYGEFSRLAAESEAAIGKYSDEHIEKLRRSSDINGALQRAEAQYERLEEDTERVKSAAASVEAEIVAAAEKTREIAERINENAEKAAFLTNQRNELIKDAEAAGQEASALDADLRAAQKRLNEASARHKLLGELERRREGYNQSVKAALSEKNARLSEFKGVCGALGELITAEPEFETAIAAALGGALQDIVVETENDAKIVIEFLKKTNAGRATFLPVTAVKPKDFGAEAARLLREDGALRVAKDTVECAGKYRDIVSSLLGRVIIFDNFDNAVKFSKKYGYNHKCATLGGEIINPGGSITGGSANSANTGIISRAREISALSDETARLNDKCAVLAAELTEKNSVLASIRDLINRQGLQIQETELQKSAGTAALARAKSDGDALNRRIDELHAEEKELMEKISEQNIRVRGLNADKKATETEISEILRALEEKQAAAAGDKKARDAKQKALSGMQSEIIIIEQKMKRADENLRRCAKAADDGRAEITKRNFEIGEADKDRLTGLNEIDAVSDEIDDLAAKLQVVVNETEIFNTRKDELRGRLAAAEETNLDRIGAVSRFMSERARLEEKAERQAAEKKRLYDGMWEEYNITYHAALKYETVAEPNWKLEMEERRLNEEIRALGSVNVGAVEEYKRLSERLGLMTKQKDDIIEAEKKLEQIICELNLLMEKRFAERLTVISKNFGEAFAEIFGGGTAYLKLSDESDVLSSGIEIIAQAPGKNLQNLSLLSGGERALTAIALLFGILRMKPSPFCVLDEIEAALDDANIKRFVNFLKKYADTQFIIITHRKGTMEAADVLYGVTMQEQGVSKLVSVKFAG